MSLVCAAELTEFDTRWALTEDQKNFGCLRGTRGALPLSELKLRAAIRGLDFSLTLTQTFVNVHDESIEATYIFPLPARAAVSAFKMTTANRVVEGVLQERGQARANYDQAIRDGKQAAMVEEERPEIFTMTVGNLPAQQTVQVELTLDGPLSCIDEHALFRFPLVVAPRYIPGRPLSGPDVGVGTAEDTDRVPDASRITPPTLLAGYPNPVALSIEIELDSPLLDASSLRSTLPLECDPSGRLVYQPASGQINHDLIVAFPFHPQEIGSSLQVQSDAFCLTLVPPAGLSQETPEKQVVILLDRSGSMQGWKMAAARRTVARLINSLNSNDYFCVVAFDTVNQEVGPAFASALVPANDQNRSIYCDALDKIEARGGTEIAPALKLAIRKLTASKHEAERHVVLVTDGQVGNEREVLALLKGRGTFIKVSTIGIDTAVNAAFLERLANTSSGLAQMVQSYDQLDESMTTLCRRIGNPLLSDIRIEGYQVADLVYQHNDLYSGLPTRIYGRLPGPLPERLTVKGLRADGSERRFDLEARPCQGTVEKLWARERVLQMEHFFAVGAPAAPKPDEITRFSLRYGVLCRFTAFLAVDEESRVKPHQLSLVQPVQQPAPGGGTIRVDLLPVERRGFQIDPLKLIVWFIFLILIALWLLKHQ